ncbi:MAG: HNH endonuclease [Polaromonas sp.]|nr:HNH endonuclease [Polaromonas sp.]
MNGSKWSPEETALLRELYADAHTEDVALLVGRSLSSVRNTAFNLGLRKSEEYLKSDTCGRAHSLQNPAVKAAQFKPGHKTWNAGLKGWNPAGSKKGHFKPGSKPPTTRPIGSERIDKDGCLMRKVSETGNRRADWKTEHSLVWAEQVGPIPAGHIVVFRAGKKTAVASAIKVEDLECLSRADLMLRNSYHRYPPEIARLHQLRGALNRQINKHTKAANESHQHRPSASA